MAHVAGMPVFRETPVLPRQQQLHERLPPHLSDWAALAAILTECARLRENGGGFVQRKQIEAYVVSQLVPSLQQQSNTVQDPDDSRRLEQIITRVTGDKWLQCSPA